MHDSTVGTGKGHDGLREPFVLPLDSGARPFLLTSYVYGLFGRQRLIGVEGDVGEGGGLDSLAARVAGSPVVAARPGPGVDLNGLRVEIHQPGLRDAGFGVAGERPPRGQEDGLMVGLLGAQNRIAARRARLFKSGFCTLITQRLRARCASSMFRVFTCHACCHPASWS
jgi:hypothetical protein